MYEGVNNTIMIKINGRWKVILSFLLAFALWSFTLLNTNLFGSAEKVDGFNSLYYIMSLLCCIIIFALGAFRIETDKRVELAVSIAAYVFAVIGSMLISILFSGGFKASAYIFFVNIAFYLFFGAVWKPPS